MRQIAFQSPEDAMKITEHLYEGYQIRGEIITYEPKQERAIELAIALAGVKNSFKVGCRCKLKFPAQERECTDEITPKIYVACLSAYNNANLHGLWIDATQEPDDILDDIKWMLSWSPVRDSEYCEEWAIHDYERFEGIGISEYEDIETISKLAQAIEKHGAAYAAYYNYEGEEYASEEDFEDRHIGEYESQEDFVYEMWKDCGKIRQLEDANIPTYYIDWKAIARDWFIDSYFSIETGHEEIQVFTR